jgi:hypothetical protein
MFFGIPLQTIEKEKGLISSQKKKKMREKKIFKKRRGKKKKLNMLDTSTKKILMKNTRSIMCLTSKEEISP